MVQSSQQKPIFHDATNLLIPVKQSFTNHKVQESRGSSEERSINTWNEIEPTTKAQHCSIALGDSPSKSQQQQLMQIHHLESTLKALSAKLKLS